MKQSVQEFLADLLRQAGCRGICTWPDSITCACPFHGNKKNFKTFRVSTVEIVNKKTGLPGYYFHCFSCGEGGSVATLVAHILGCSRQKALRIFEKRTNVSSITIDTLRRDLEKFHDATGLQELPDIDMPPHADSQKPLWNYMKKRKRTAHGFWNIRYLVDKYNLYYCESGRMSGRIIMPIKDMDGKIVCYNDRSIIDNEAQKSLHIKSFPYGRLLHGLYESLGKRHVVLVEGAFDMFAVDCAVKGTKMENRLGIVNMMGTAFTDDRLDLLTMNFSRIYLMLDNDEAGRNMSAEILKQHGGDNDIKYCTESYPKGKDPAICNGEELLHAIRCPRRRQGYLEYLMRKYEADA